ncbi:hypothetical protein [Arcticibacter sp. MXS-1]|uniref:hypothetical protein n=1 Tax=Arcticibacter sp. MXS-1 TaxID=3341726 RepID=UPI0035A8303D
MKITILLPAILLFFLSCKTDHPSGSNPPDGEADSALSPVETKPANTNYKPAFEGQTRVAGTRTRTPLDISTVAEGLANPWGMVNLPDGRILITEKGGDANCVFERRAEREDHRPASG